MEQLTRSQLFGLVSSKSNREIITELFNEPDVLIKLFSESSLFILVFETKLLDTNIEKSAILFNELFYLNLKLIEDDTFRDFINREYSKINESSERKTRTFNDSFNQLIRIIARYHSKIIEKLYKLPTQDNEGKIKHFNTLQTFLSYAYDDKGITLGLYLYFLNHGGFLYIDWMWHGRLKGINIKDSVNAELNKSIQFLFLRSPNSELETSQGERMIRQWCSWEIGRYYNLKSNKKYYTNFYKSKKPSNELLCDFSQAHHVKDGLIH